MACAGPGLPGPRAGQVFALASPWPEMAAPGLEYAPRSTGKEPQWGANVVQKPEALGVTVKTAMPIPFGEPS